MIQDYDGFVGHEIIITEKMDGENATLYRDHSHARSLDSRHHPSWDWLKRFHAEIAYRIPPGWRICGENLYATHSIHYTGLESYFYGFSIWNAHNVALSWDDTRRWFEDLGIVPVPVLYRGPFVLQELLDLAARLDTERHEGFVVRIAGAIPYERFGQQVAKWVRPGHVQTDSHWRHAPLVLNQLA
ncbi:MAG: RNA ligase family protein [Candidatus Competibacteraceae bacterium]